MKTLLAGLQPWIAALWWGSLSSIGFLAVPLLFAHLPSKTLAGNMAAQLFTAQTWVAVVCGLLLLLQARAASDGASGPDAPAALPAILGGLLLALVSEFVVAPHIVARDQLALWHSLGTLAYVLQWLCAALVFRALALKRAPGRG